MAEATSQEQAAPAAACRTREHCPAPLRAADREAVWPPGPGPAGTVAADVLPARPVPDKVAAAERVPTDLEILRRVRDGLARQWLNGDCAPHLL